MSALENRETIELLADRPDLLAIADAVASTQRAGRRRLSRLALAVPAALAAAIAVALLTPWQGSGPGTIERALAAVSAGPVVHALVESTQPHDVLVDVESGEVRPRMFRTEYWYDGDRKVLRTRLLVDGTKLTESVDTPERTETDLGSRPNRGELTPRLDAALAGFVTQYREALESGTAEVVGETTVDGRPAKLIRLALDRGQVQVVTVDAETHEPLTFFTEWTPPRAEDPRSFAPRRGPRTRAARRDGQPSGRPLIRRVQTVPRSHPRRSPVWRVVMIESLPRDESLFARPNLASPRPTGSLGSGSEETSLAAAGEALGRPPLWLGPSFDGRAVVEVRVSRYGIEFTDGTQREGTVVTISYGDVTISQAVDVAGSYQLGFNDGGGPDAPSGFLAITTPKFADSDAARTWARARGEQAELRSNGMYVALEVRGGIDLLQAARALRPLP